MNDTKNPYAGYRHPAEIISHAVWLYFRFTLSYRDVEELLAARGLIVTYETVRQWCLKFGQDFANELRRRAPRRGDNGIWMRSIPASTANVSISGARWIRTAMCSIFWFSPGVTSAPPSASFRKLLKGLRYVPRVIITDQLKSYGAARKELMPGVEHRQHKGLNNRAELSHQPTRQRERPMRRFKSPGHAQRFLSAHGPINNHFRPRRHRMAASDYRAVRTQAFETWQQVTCAQKAD